MATTVAARDLKAGHVVARAANTFRVLADTVEFRGMAEFPVEYDPPTEYGHFDVYTLPPDTPMDVLDDAAVAR